MQTVPLIETKSMVIHPDKRYLIDTNILVYSVTPNSENHLLSIEFISSILESGASAYISTQNILEFQRIVSKPTNKSQNQVIYEAIDVFMSEMELIYEDASTWAVYKKLNKKYEPTSNKIFDLWLASTAIANGIDIIATNNVKDFEYIKEIKCVNPFAI